MANERNWATYKGGSDISLSDVRVSSAPNSHAPCYGCAFLKIDGKGFYCTFPDDAERRECNPGFGALATVYKKI